MAVAPQALSNRLAGIADDGRAVGRHRERAAIGAAGVHGTSRSARTVPDSSVAAGGAAALDGAVIDVTPAPLGSTRFAQGAILTAAGGIAGTPVIQLSDATLESYAASDRCTRSRCSC